MFESIYTTTAQLTYNRQSSHRDDWRHELGELPIYVKVWLEGEDESGSSHLQAFLDLRRKRLRVDDILFLVTIVLIQVCHDDITHSPF